MSAFPFKLARTTLDITPRAGSLYMSCKVNYQEPLQWTFQPWRVPTNLVKEPLTSFVAGQNVEAFLKPDETLASFNTEPFRGQFYFWSMGEMPLESYIAWPEENPREALKNLSSPALSGLNPKLKALDDTELVWHGDLSQLIWTKLNLASPHLEPGPASAPDYIVGGLFPVTTGRGPVPGALWDQFKDRTDMIYYDWELTGPRIIKLLSVTQMVPILKMLGIGEDAPYTGGKTPSELGVGNRLRIQEGFLVNLSSLLGNTVTEVTRSGSREVTIVRNSPFVFSSLELVLISHLLTDTPAGPIDYNLIQQAKFSGPGIPPQH
jgi:hypothetical protein